MKNNFNILSQFNGDSKSDLNLNNHMLNFASSGSEENDFNSKKEGESVDNSLSHRNQPTPPFAGQSNSAPEQRPYPPYNQPQKGYQENPYMGNGQYPPPPPMNNGYYGGYPPAGAYREKATHEELKKMRSVAIGSIVMFFLWLIFLILMIVAFGSFAAATISNASASVYSPSSPSDPLISSATASAAVFLSVAVVFLVLFWAIGNLVCGIVGSVRASGLSKKVDSFSTIMILYIIGIFFPIIQVVAAFMAISKIKKMTI